MPILPSDEAATALDSISYNWMFTVEMCTEIIEEFLILKNIR